MKIRMSSFPRILSCCASSVLPDIDIDTSSDASRQGTAIHAVLEEVIRNDLTSLPENFNEIAVKYQIDDLKDMRILSFNGINAWLHNIKPHMNPKTVRVEQEVSFIIKEEDGVVVWEALGHIDVCGVSIDGQTLIVVDHKAGYIESDYNNQLKGYAYGALKMYLPEYPDINKIITIIPWLRSQTLDVQTYPVDDILLFPLEVEAALESSKYAPSPDNCRFCSNYDCEAKNAMSRDTINSLVTLSQEDNSLSKTLKLGKLYPKIQFVEQQAKKAKELIKEHLRATGQRIPLDNGKYLGLREESRDEINLAKGAATINGFLSDDLVMTVDRFAEMISPFVKVSKTKLLDAVAMRSEKGERGRDKMRIVAMLEEYNAISKTTIEKLSMFSEGEPE